MSEPATILGCGVMGLCVAAELSARDLKVRMIDPQSGPGPQSCSWWAGGMLAPDCESELAEEPVVRLGRDAVNWWEGQGASVTHNGSLVLALDRDQGELKRFARRTQNHEWLDRSGVERLEPHLAERFDSALFMQAEAHLNPRKTILDLKDRLIRNGVEVSEDGTPSGETIDCTGLAAKGALAELRGVKGEMVILRTGEIELSRPVRLLHPRFPLYIVPRGDGVFMLGATQLESGERHGATVRSVVELLNAAYALHPAFAEAEIVEIGMDARPAFPDNLPRISRIGETLFANGLFRHGFLLAPAVACMVADYLTNGKTPEFWHAH
ncbi:MAG: FAD-dependent oxidoreductase [Pseudomonadota bacterium]